MGYHLTCLLLAVLVGLVSVVALQVPDVRPTPANRTYTSPGINTLIEQLSSLWANEELGTMFANCFPNTLDTTVMYHDGKADSFIITGDIQALWLRDSTNQVLPYVPYAATDPALKILLQGLISRQARSINIDSFANAFNYDGSGSGDSDAHQDDSRKPPMTPWIFEGKYEIDSISAFLKLSYYYHSSTKDASFAGPAGTGTNSSSSEWLTAAGRVVGTIAAMQDIGQDPSAAAQPYSFQRQTTVATDTLEMAGLGPAGHRRIGLSRSLFRPSDDAVSLPYNTPGNAMACVELKHLVSLLENKDIIAQTGAEQAALVRAQATQVAKEICGALQDMRKEADLRASFHAHLQQQGGGGGGAAMDTAGALPYETDGFGSALYMDDANIPSLLSLPLLGYMSRKDPVYVRTRKLVLSGGNPFFFAGSAGAGVGGPHVGYQFAWPMSIAVAAMTSDSDDEVSTCLEHLLAASAATGLMHESFNVNNVTDFTRPWFAWANGLFGELMLQLISTKPHLVLQDGAVAKAQALVQPTVSLLALQEAEERTL